MAGVIASGRPVWSTDDLKIESTRFIFMILFLIISIVISFLFSLIWAKWVHPLQCKIINRVRVWRNAAAFSENPSVWDEVFLKHDSQVVEIGKIDKEEGKLVGCIRKASRTFEPERNLILDDVDFFTELVKEHKIPVLNVFIDTKSGTYIKIFDPEAIEEAQKQPISSAEE